MRSSLFYPYARFITVFGLVLLVAMHIAMLLSVSLIDGYLRYTIHYLKDPGALLERYITLLDYMVNNFFADFYVTLGIIIPLVSCLMISGFSFVIMLRRMRFLLRGSRK